MNKLRLLLLLLSVNILCQAQKHTYFMGKRDIVSFGTEIPLYGIAKHPISELPLSLSLGIDRLMNSYISIGAQYKKQMIGFYDEFVNDGNQHNYYINYNNLDRRITDGNGDIKLNTNLFLFNIKKYNKTTSYVPIGAFYSFKIGFSTNSIIIPNDYIFKYTQLYNNSSEKVYTSASKQSIGFTKIHWGVEYGKTFRFLRDKMFFTTTICYLNSSSNQYTTSNLNDRFRMVAEKRLRNTNLLNLNFALGYAIK